MSGSFGHTASRAFFLPRSQSEYKIQVNFKRVQLRSSCRTFSQDFNVVICSGGRVRFSIEFHTAIRNIYQPDFGNIVLGIEWNLYIPILIRGRI